MGNGEHWIALWQPKGVDAAPRLVTVEKRFTHSRKGSMVIASLVFDGGRMIVVPENEIILVQATGPEVRFLSEEEEKRFRIPKIGGAS